MPEKSASKKEQTTLVAERKRPLERLAGGVMLCGWGVAKLAAAKLTPVVFPTLLRVNLPAVVGLLALQFKSGRKGFLPLEVQAVLASLYTAVALGVTKLPRPTGDRFPDVSAPNEGE